jgi:two-component system, LytTR family, sensor kinase
VTGETERRGLKWLLGFLLWSGIGLAFAAQFYVSAAKAGQAISWQSAIVWSLGDWYVWALLSIVVFRLARRFPLEGKQWVVCLAIHICGSIVTSAAYIFVRAGLASLQSHLQGQPADFLEIFQALLIKTLFFNALIYWVIVSVSHALNYYRRYRERELRASELERNLTAAKLKALQMQLNPHFLFNALHAISALMHKDVNAADRMISRLSDLLRRALDSGEAQEVPLHQEIDFLRRYLEIEQTRFGDRLEVRFEIPNETTELLVPNLILQPLVENAIKHGIEPHARRGIVQISSRRDGNRLVLEVRDNGGGLANDYDERIGLANTRSRLDELYGVDHAFEFETAASGGVLAKITIPATE